MNEARARAHVELMPGSCFEPVAKPSTPDVQVMRRWLAVGVWVALTVGGYLAFGFAVARLING